MKRRAKPVSKRTRCGLWGVHIFNPMVFNNKPVEEAVIVVTYQPTIPIGSAHFFTRIFNMDFALGSIPITPFPIPEMTPTKHRQSTLFSVEKKEHCNAYLQKQVHTSSWRLLRITGARPGRCQREREKRRNFCFASCIFLGRRAELNPFRHPAFCFLAGQNGRK